MQSATGAVDRCAPGGGCGKREIAEAIASGTVWPEAKARMLWLQMTLKSGSEVILYTRRRVLLPSTLTGGEHVTGVAVRSARESFAIV